MPEQTPPQDERGSVVHFRHRRSADLAEPEDLAKFESAGEPDDYRHRMLVNVAAGIFVVVLIGSGLWLANTMADIRKNQDCALSGRRNCAPIEVPRDRW